MKTNEGVKEFCESLIGAWVGHRRSTEFEHEIVRSYWQKSFDGNFLHENWHTAGRGGSPEPTAEAFFNISNSSPGDFIAVYKSGKIAFGESIFTNCEWRLTHHWLREPGVATIRLKFLDANTYEQEVTEVASDGSMKPESRAIMKREQVTP